MKKISLDISTHYKSFDKTLLPVLKRAVQATFDLVAEAESYSVSILICGDEQITELNKTYRGVNRATDVLSFTSDVALPDSDDLFLGDIVISFPAVVRQAEKYQHSVSHELSLLSIHGVLHLLGYDHSTISEEAQMWHYQKLILNSIGFISDLLPGELYAQE